MSADDLAVRQARDTAALTREVIGGLTDERCPDCHGAGWIGFGPDDAWHCQLCEGTGHPRCEQCDRLIAATPVRDEWGSGPPFCGQDCRDAHAETRASR